MPVIEIDSLTHPGVEVFGALTEPQLRNRLEPEQGIFIAESPKVIDAALDAGCQPTALLCERRHIDGDASGIIARCGDTPVYTGDRTLLASLTGYTLTRGVLCAMRRPVPPTLDDVCHKSQRIVVADSVSNAANIGAIFRAAAALGMDGVLVTSTSCDPLNRRSLRVSMGTVFMVPWTRVESVGEQLYNDLRKQGFRIAAMALSDNSVSIDDDTLRHEPRLAIVLGAEGDGLPQQAIMQADYVVRIPMQNGVDSLNVAAAAAVAFWELSDNH